MVKTYRPATTNESVLRRGDFIAPVLHEVGRHFGRDQRDPRRVVLLEPQLDGEVRRRPAHGADLTRVPDRDLRQVPHRHRAIMTFVPSPGRDSIWNSFESRLAPPSPRPNPEPLV